MTCCWPSSPSITDLKAPSTTRCKALKLLPRCTSVSPASNSTTLATSRDSTVRVDAGIARGNRSAQCWNSVAASFGVTG
jgi:hypothetical protein